MILRTINSEVTLSSVSEQIMITQGEWELLNMTIIYYSFELKNVSENRLIYTVRKFHNIVISTSSN